MIYHPPSFRFVKDVQQPSPPVGVSLCSLQYLIRGSHTSPLDWLVFLYYEVTEGSYVLEQVVERQHNLIP